MFKGQSLICISSVVDLRDGFWLVGTKARRRIRVGDTIQQALSIMGEKTNGVIYGVSSLWPQLSFETQLIISCKTKNTIKR